jgi:hypothetical protein
MMSEMLLDSKTGPVPNCTLPIAILTVFSVIWRGYLEDMCPRVHSLRTFRVDSRVTLAFHELQSYTN